MSLGRDTCLKKLIFLKTFDGNGNHGPKIVISTLNKQIN